MSLCSDTGDRVAGGAFALNLAPALDATRLALLAVRSMIDEAELTPKPGLVDASGSGAHADLDLDLMRLSARSLFPCFRKIAATAAGATPSQGLREQVAAIGRDGECAMFTATGGVNTHKGAIWTIGLLVAGVAMSADPADPAQIAERAAGIARHPDTRAPEAPTNGSRVAARYRVAGARGEARLGFPHVIRHGLPALRNARARGADESCARLDALIAIMAELDDTCLLHRGGAPALEAAKQGARKVLARGGAAAADGMRAVLELDRRLLACNASPGGSGDLLAATLFLDSVATLSAGIAAANEQPGAELKWKY